MSTPKRNKTSHGRVQVQLWIAGFTQSQSKGADLLVSQNIPSTGSKS